MAVLKPVVTPQGVNATYHKLIKADFDSRTRTCTMMVAIYPTKAARDANATPLWHEYPVVPFSAFPGNMLQVMYNVLMGNANSYLVGGVSDETNQE